MRRAEWLIERPWRLVALVFLLALPFVVVGELDTLDAQQRLERDRRDAIRSGASRAAEAIVSRSGALFTALSGVGETGRFRDSLGVAIRRDATAPIEQIVPADDRELTLQLVALHAATRNDLALLFAVDSAGIVHAAHPPVVAGRSTHETLVGSDQRDAPYSLALANRDPRYIGPHGGDIFIAVPVGETTRGPGGTRGGVLVGQLAADAIARWVAALSGSVADIHVVDRTGILLARLNGAITSPDISGHVAVRSALSGQPFVGQAPTLAEPGSALYATASVGDLGWHVIAQARPDLAQAELDNALMQQRVLRLGLFAALLLGTALVGMSSSRAIRQRRETRDALEQQTALSEVLNTISRSAFDLDSVLQTIVERATSLCDADGAAIHRRDGDVCVLAAQHGEVMTRLVPVGTPVEIDDETVVGRAMLTGERQYTPDVRQDPALPQGGPQTRLCIPFVRDGRTTGTLGVVRAVARPYSDTELRLFEVFADQAAIAIENVRLFNETTEALRQQTAIAEILGVISRSPADVQPVLDAVAANAAQLLDANDVVIVRREGNEIVGAAHVGNLWLRPGHGQREALDPGMVSHRAILEARTVHLPDVLAAADEFPTAVELARETGQRTALAVPLLREGSAIGSILIRRLEVRPYSDQQIRLLQTFADQAAIAIENVRLFNETKEALERQTALAEILSAISASPTETQPVFEAIARNAARYCAAEDAVVHVVDGSVFHPVAHFGPIGAKSPAYEWPVDRSTVSGRAIVDRAIVQVDDLQAADAEFPLGATQARDFAYHSILVAPLLRKGESIGALLLRRLDTRPFATQQVDLLEGIRGPSRHRDRERAPLQRNQGGARAADRDELDLERDQSLACGPAADAGCDRGERRAFMRRGHGVRLRRRAGLLQAQSRVTRSRPHSSSTRTAIQSRWRHTAAPSVDGSSRSVARSRSRTFSRTPSTRTSRGNDSSGYRSMLNVPMFSKGELIGLIGLWRTAPVAFTTKQID